MNTEEHDDLWRLLGKAREPSPSPMFSRNVLREIRELEQDRPGVVAWLRRYWQIPVAAACSILIAVNVASDRNEVAQQQQAEPDELLAMAERVSESPDYLVISHLDELLASEQNSLWLDSNVY